MCGRVPGQLRDFVFLFLSKPTGTCYRQNSFNRVQIPARCEGVKSTRLISDRICKLEMRCKILIIEKEQTQLEQNHGLQSEMGLNE